jgi:outer membrane protein insertion porin family
VRQLEFHFFNPHLFDSDLGGNFFLYRKWDEYDQVGHVDKTPRQSTTGALFQLLAPLPQIDPYLQMVAEVGVERVKNNQPKPSDKFPEGPQRDAYELFLNKSYQQGTLQWVSLNIVKDRRNHQIYPSDGYRFNVSFKFAPSATNKDFSFLKSEFEASFYTPLILPDLLVLVLHGRVGDIRTVGNSKIIPYKELFHMGGQHSVRGFVWGSIGPAWKFANGQPTPVGGRHAVQFNAELVFPLIPDYSMKGHFFYDAGAGWSAPEFSAIENQALIRNKFNLRHSVGFGLNLTQPTPAKIDWGFKLDRKKGESAHEFHLSMNYAW